jgi:tyrosyl-tRNA synthetase
VSQLDLEYLLRRGVAEVIIENELRELLNSGRPLRLKQGFDPSRPDIHMGHVVGLRKLSQFQKLGHHVILIVGDWTARIGDPSGESATRPMLSAEEVKANAQTYMQQFFKVVDREKTEVRWQSEWLSDLGLDDIIKLTSRFTLAQFLARDDFHSRHAAGKPIALTEMLYPLLQAYDSVMVQADVEFGGIDQKFNCLVGRELQGMMGQRPQQILLMPLLVGTDGVHKMSKSLGNYIGVNDPPQEMYGKVMSIPDNLILDYFETLTDVPDEDLATFRRQMEDGSVNPMALKKRLAKELVEQFHDIQAARQAEEHFVRVFQRRELPEDVPELRTDGHRVRDGVYRVDLAVALVEGGLAQSRSEVKRLVAQGAVEMGGTKVENTVLEIPDGEVLKVGKRSFVRLTIEADRSTKRGG